MEAPLDPKERVFDPDPAKCVCAVFGESLRKVSGHHGQCRWAHERDAVVGMTSAEALAKVGPPKPHVPR